MKKMICPKCGSALVKMKRKLVNTFLIKLAVIAAPISKYKCELCFLKKIEEQALSVLFIWSK